MLSFNNRLSDTTQRQRGVSALFMVLVLLFIGGLMAGGLHQQVNSNMSNSASEVQAIQQFSLALSAQDWATRQHWTASSHWQCQQDTVQHWRACLRGYQNGVILVAHGLSVATSPIILWQRGQLVADQLRYSPHGWSDFCPFREVELCQLPAITISDGIGGGIQEKRKSNSSESHDG